MNVQKYLKANAKVNGRHFEFDTIHEFVNVLENAPTNPVYSDEFINKKGSNANFMKNFWLTDSLPEAVNLLKYGWDSGSKEMVVKLSKLVTNKRLSFKPEYNVVGGQASVPRYLQGLPTNMILNKNVEKDTKIINVYKSAGYHGFYTPEEIMKESVKALQIVQLLENNRYRVNVYVVKYNEGKHEGSVRSGVNFGTKIKIKSANEKMNIKKMAFCLAHPDFQRRLIWRLIEINPDFKKVFVGYGKPVENDIIAYDNKSKSRLSKDKYSEIFKFNENDIFIPTEINGDGIQFLKDIGGDIK